MYAGAGLTAVELIVYLVTIGSLKSAIHKAFPNYSAARVHQVEVTSIVFTIIILLVAMGLWIWMARANAAGRAYARIVGTVLFALNTLGLVAFFARPYYNIGVVFNVLIWLAGLGAVALLWRKESGPYFAPTRSL